jgi:hypothetical protein
MRVDESRVRARSTAYWFDIRRSSFCLLVAGLDRHGCCVDPDELEALPAIGHPFFAPRGGRGRLGLWLTAVSDWHEVRELVIESYRDIAPKKLIALID